MPKKSVKKSTAKSRKASSASARAQKQPTRKELKEALPGAIVFASFSKYFFVALIVAVLALFFWVIAPFFDVLVYAGLIAIIFYPLHKLVMKLTRGWKSFSALVTTLVATLVVLVPLTLFAIFIAQEAVDTYQLFEGKMSAIQLENIHFNGLGDVPYVGEYLLSFSQRFGLPSFVQDLDANVVTYVKDTVETVSTFVFTQGTNFVIGLGDAIVSLLVMLLAIFFFLRDGDGFTKTLRNMSPLPKRHEDEIESKLKKTTYGIVFGNFGTAVLQGFFAGVGFAIAGVENAVFWGTIMAFASLIPYIGTAIIWVPVVIVMLIQQNYFWAGFLVVWGMVIVATVDNIARPFLIGKGASMHPLATFLVVVGGIIVFGMKGIIFGPLILSLTVTVMHIYQLEYKDLLKQLS